MFHKHASSPHKGVYPTHVVHTLMRGKMYVSETRSIKHASSPHKGVYPTHVGYTPLWGGRCMFLKHAISSQNLGTVCSCKRVTPAIERKWKKQIREKQEWTAWCAWHAYLYSFKQGRLYSPMTCIFIFF